MSSQRNSNWAPVGIPLQLSLSWISLNREFKRMFYCSIIGQNKGSYTILRQQQIIGWF